MAIDQVQCMYRLWRFQAKLCNVMLLHHGAKHMQCQNKIIATITTSKLFCHIEELKRIIIIM